MCCIPQSLHLPDKREPRHVPTPLAHTLCVSATGSEPRHHSGAGPAAPSPAKAASSPHFQSVSRVANIFTSLSWFHVADTSSVMGNHMLSVKSVLGLREIFLTGKDIKVSC